MAVTARRVSVDDTGARLDGFATAHQTGELLVENTGASDCFLGGSDVTASDGKTLGVDASMQLRLAAGGELYAICGSGNSTTVEVLEITP